MIGPSLLALLSGLGLGATDFFGGRCSARHGTGTVLVVTQLASLAVVATIFLSAFRTIGSTTALVAAAAAGICELVGTAAIYRGLRTARASLVAPSAALGPLVPLAVDLAGGIALAPMQLVGGGTAITGVIVVSSAGDDGDRAGPRGPGIGFGLLASTAFGGYLALIGIAGNAGGPVPALFVDRAASVIVLGLALLIARRRPGIGTLRPTALGAIAGVGALISLSDLAYTTATTLGVVTIAAALTSTHPVFTVLWARLVDGERISPTRGLGILLTATGATLVVAA